MNGSATRWRTPASTAWSASRRRGGDLAAAAWLRARLANAQQERPFGYLVRRAPANDVKDLQQLAGHLAESLFITKFRKTFARDEMNDDLSIVPACDNGAEDTSEYKDAAVVGSMSG
jgi:hypothetical protein